MLQFFFFLESHYRRPRGRRVAVFAQNLACGSFFDKKHDIAMQYFEFLKKNSLTSAFSIGVAAPATIFCA
jgi:hypothetical protein